MDNFLAIGIVGVVLSLIIEVLKRGFGTNGTKTKVLTLVLALVVGSGYYFLKDTPYWPTILGVLGSASTVYAFFFKTSTKTDVQ